MWMNIFRTSEQKIHLEKCMQVVRGNLSFNSKSCKCWTMFTWHILNLQLSNIKDSFTTLNLAAIKEKPQTYLSSSCTFCICSKSSPLLTYFLRVPTIQKLLRISKSFSSIAFCFSRSSANYFYSSSGRSLWLSPT